MAVSIVPMTRRVEGAIVGAVAGMAVGVVLLLGELAGGAGVVDVLVGAMAATIIGAVTGLLGWSLGNKGEGKGILW